MITELLIRTAIAYVLLTIASYIIIGIEEKKPGYLLFEKTSCLTSEVYESMYKKLDEDYEEVLQCFYTLGEYELKTESSRCFLKDVWIFVQKNGKTYETATFGDMFAAAEELYRMNKEEIESIDFNETFKKQREKARKVVSLIPFMRFVYIIKLSRLNLIPEDKVRELAEAARRKED